MKILQFAFGGDGSHEYLPHNFHADTVVYTGTHDNETIMGWWANATERERAFAGAYLGADSGDFHWAMIRAASNSVARLAIFPMQDVLGLPASHRMNHPGTLGGGNWAWRFDWHMVGEEAVRVLGALTAASGRGSFDLLRLPG
jgi:4-alpha-glucanotransferase